MTVEEVVLGRGAEQMRVALYPARDHRALGNGGVLLLAHGRGGAEASPHMVPIREAALRLGLAVVAPDLRFSDANESAGRGRDFRMGAHRDDMARVLDWITSDQRPALLPEPGAGPLVIAGHSMGGYGALALAVERAAHVDGILAVCPVVSGKAILEARAAMGQPALDALEAEVPGATADYAQHDLAPIAPQITQPVVFVVGELDGLARAVDVRAFGRLLPDRLSYVLLPHAHHCPSGENYALALREQLALLLRAILIETRTQPRNP
ncbi:MAG: alpha/beta fold hydrolase [Pseudomonadota bacterium]